jgi:hypothetical protein
MGSWVPQCKVRGMYCVEMNNKGGSKESECRKERKRRSGIDRIDTKR